MSIDKELTETVRIDQNVFENNFLGFVKFSGFSDRYSESKSFIVSNMKIRDIEYSSKVVLMNVMPFFADQSGVRVQFEGLSFENLDLAEGLFFDIQSQTRQSNLISNCDFKNVTNGHIGINSLSLDSDSILT